MSKRVERTVLGAILLLFAAISIIGITWGLPSRQIDKYLFGDAEPWPGEKIYRLADAGEKFSPDRGADVDVDPLDRPTDKPILLTGTEEDLAKIYLRYRLYTYQPDEMITMMALAGMRPGKLSFDPRLYQYGGLFIYPVGALIRLCGLVGLIDVRSDLIYYLDNPAEFGKFYVVARAYSAAWGLVGVLVVFAISTRLAGGRAGLLASLLFALMPVVVCMAHEGKPHLPGAVLMLLAVLFAMRQLNRAAGFSLRDDTVGEGPSSDDTSHGVAQRSSLQQPAARFDWWIMCVCCGAALGMVLNTWPIFVLIPLVAWRVSRRSAGFNMRDDTVGESGSPGDSSCGAAQRSSLRYPAAQDPLPLSLAARILTKTVIGTTAAIGVYIVTNPYVPINALINREVLRSNFGNSLAMYEIDRVYEGFIRVLELTVEGATVPVLVLGVIGLLAALVRWTGRARGKIDALAVLAVPSAVFFLQFVLIGAGKPAEYGRFGIFTNTALAIGAASAAGSDWTRIHRFIRWVLPLFVLVWAGMFAGGYLRNFRVDATDQNSRIELAKQLAGLATAPLDPSGKQLLAVFAEPAPYCCPPIDFAGQRLLLVRSRPQLERHAGGRRWLLIRSVDSTPPTLDETFQALSQEPGWWSGLAGDTPISWANKPFELAWADVRHAPD